MITAHTHTSYALVVRLPHSTLTARLYASSSSASFSSFASPKSLVSYRAAFLSKILIESAVPPACAPTRPAPMK